MIVKDIMTADLVTIHPATRVAEIAALMLRRHLSGLPVVDDDGTLVGLVTERDLVAKHARVHLPLYLGILGTVLPLDTRRTKEDLRHALAVTAADLMTEDPQIIEADASIDDAATLMVERAANPLPVVEGGRLIGIVSQADIVRVLLQEEGDAG